jgi:hypothetical protein
MTQRMMTKKSGSGGLGPVGELSKITATMYESVPVQYCSTVRSGNPILTGLMRVLDSVTDTNYLNKCGMLTSVVLCALPGLTAKHP